VLKLLCVFGVVKDTDIRDYVYERRRNKFHLVESRYLLICSMLIEREIE